MITEWKQTSTVTANGKVEIIVPELREGDLVEVVVRMDKPAATPGERSLGLLRGKIQMAPDFDAPLGEFDDHT